MERLFIKSYSKETFCWRLEIEAISPCHKCREGHHLEKDSDPKPYNRVSPLLPMYRRPFHGRLHLKHRQPKEHLNKQEMGRHLNPRKEYKKLWQTYTALRCSEDRCARRPPQQIIITLYFNHLFQVSKIKLGLGSRFTIGRREKVPQMPD